MSADRYWQRHGRMGMRVNDNDAAPDNETRATVYAAGRSTDHQPYPFFIALGVRAGGMSFDASMSPATARELAAALLSAADDCDLQHAAAAAMPAQVAA